MTSCDPTAEGPPLRLLTLNTLFTGDVAARLTAIGEFLARRHYDVVCLQELMYRRHLRLLAPRHSGEYPFRAAHGAVALGGGLAVLSSRPLRRSRFTHFPPTLPLRPEYLMRKGVQRVSVDVDGCELVVITSHLSADRDDDWRPANRYARAQVVELRRLARVVAAVDPALPLVLVGDLNLPPDAPAFAEFVGRAGLLPVPTGPTYRPQPGYLDPPIFDHVLVRAPRAQALSATTRTVLVDEQVSLPDGRSAYLSDHYGIEVTIDLDHPRIVAK